MLRSQKMKIGAIEKAISSIRREISGHGLGGYCWGKQRFCFFIVSFLPLPIYIGGSRWKVSQALKCYLSQDFMLSWSVSINQSFAIKFKQQCSKPSQVIKYELINFPLICMIIKIRTFNSVNFPPTRRLIGLC